MKTQIEFKTAIFVLLTLIVTPIVWGNVENPSRSNFDVESSTLLSLNEHLIEINQLEKTQVFDVYANEFDGNETFIIVHPDPVRLENEVIYEVEASTNVEIDVYRGTELIITLVDNFQEAGSYRVTLDTSTLPPGEYSVVMRTDYGSYEDYMSK